MSSSNSCEHTLTAALSLSTCSQSKRISAKDALAHPYLDEGRLRYHTCMCKCCFSTSTGRVYTSDFEPITNPKFDDTFEKNLSSVRQVKGEQELTLCVQLSPCSTLQQGMWDGVGMELGFVLWIHTVTLELLSFRYFSIVDPGNNFFSPKEQNCKCSEIRQWHKHELTCRSL